MRADEQGPAAWSIRDGAAQRVAVPIREQSADGGNCKGGPQPQS